MGNETQRSSTLAQEAIGALAVVGISLGLLLIPIVHFVSGPFGPAIGAFLVAQRVKPGGRGVAVMALVAGLGFGAIVAGAVVALVAATITGSPMEDTSAGWRAVVGKPDFPATAGAIAFAWGTLLAAGGALAGAAAAHGTAEPESAENKENS